MQREVLSSRLRPFWRGVALGPLVLAAIGLLSACAYVMLLPAAPPTHEVTPARMTSPAVDIGGGLTGRTTSSSLIESRFAPSCEPRDQMPLVACSGSTMHYDGCRWACWPMFEVLPQ